MPFRPLHRAPGGATAPYCSVPELCSPVMDQADICRRSDGFAATLSTHGQRPAFHGLARFSAVRLAPVLGQTILHYRIIEKLGRRVGSDL
jgi:hypothetical protein